MDSLRLNKTRHHQATHTYPDISKFIVSLGLKG